MRIAEKLNNIVAKMDKSNLSALEIYLTKSRKIVLSGTSDGVRQSSPAAVSTFNRNLMSLGFVCSQELTGALACLPEDSLGKLYNMVTPILKQMVGAHRAFKPFYPNFPKQVMEASELELYLNAMTHYWTAFVGDVLNIPMRWLPEYGIEYREELPEQEISLKVIGFGSDTDFHKIFTRLIGSNGSLPESDKDIVTWFVENRCDLIPSILPPAIPQKENLTYLFGQLLQHQVPTYLTKYLKTSTDILRVAVAMSKGDVSLAENTKFRRFKRSERRFLLNAMETIPSITEDMLRRPEVWKRLGHELRPGDYSTQYPKTYLAFHIVRSGESFPTFNSKVEEGFILGNVEAITSLLKTRPGDFARRLDHLLRISGEEAGYVVNEFREVADRVSTPVLLQAHAHFEYGELVEGRSFFPKGNVAKVQFGEKASPSLPSHVATTVAWAIRSALVNRFKVLPTLGKVYIEQALQTQFVPFAQRSASKSLRTISRGSRIDLPECSTLRFFVWWKELKGSRTDIDLTATMFNTDWKRTGDISYYNLRELGCAHSGDITSAPNGACEFIDVNMSKLLKAGIRYVQMNIYSFTKQAFKDMPECYAGWMARSEVQSSEIFDARTVQDKIDIAGDTTINIPLFIDLQERQMIWADIALKTRNFINNSRRNSDGLSLMGKAIANLCKPNLYDLFEMHAEARGIQISSPATADTYFGLYDGITPFDTDKIMSEFMVDAPNPNQNQNPNYVTYCTWQR